MVLDLILNEHVTELVFTAAAAVGITAAAYIASDGGLSERLRKATIILYLYIIVSLSIHATILVFKEKEDLSESPGLGCDFCFTRVTERASRIYRTGTEATYNSCGDLGRLRPLSNLVPPPNSTSIPPGDVNLFQGPTEQRCSVVSLVRITRVLGRLFICSPGACAS